MNTQNAASAAALEKKRVQESLARHTDRIEWLSAPNPEWSDGTPVSSADRSMLLRQSRGVLSGEIPA